MSTEARDFDKEAAGWDEHPTRVQLAQDVASAIARAVPLGPTMDVLDFGCGTGIATLQLAASVGTVTGVDSSQGMLDVLKAKIDRQGCTNVTTRRLHPGDEVAGAYDLIVTSMTLHHVADIDAQLTQFFRALKASGWLCVADLDPEQGEFHDDNTGVFHFGFDRDALRCAFVRAGFADVHDVTATEVVKPTHKSGLRTFRVFLMTGQKTAR
jgi:ubiquinone/menaquinone biosynthesis C-methylase UbiE